ncbi:MAG TPA: murein biosynthesis integral membrane protein MurJ [Flexilinea sp.]|nr:murein biosynthesis integral membrane protein MurJ [Flexilinea sp.]HPJ65677.1 murein biosynthesis integral membrane protein MurJ [Flexilinea sp.]HPR70095.1 murein biosynthesis integral membrane protein MurJ [Flexilinea sp.]
MKLSSLSRTSLMIVVFFGIDKVIAIIRQLIIARQFGLSPELDVFNIANNLPDMLFILISGGAMAMVIIPIMTEIIQKESRDASWRVFSSIANLAFVVSLILAIFIAIFARPIVTSEIGIAPGFTTEQQGHVVNMMRLNLIATLIFSISGLVMGGLQANRKFFLSAMAPILYNIGQIFGAVVLSPQEPYKIGQITLPAFGIGIYGLAGGVIIGAILHLFIQIPGLIRLKFKWYPMIQWKDSYVQKTIRIMIPRILTVFFVQLIFIIRDNLASRLETGSVTALSYGYMFQQLPETLIGTALGTAILPSLSLFISENKKAEFQKTFETACRLSVALTIGVAVIMGIGLGPIVQRVLGFDVAENALLMWTLRGFLVGLTGHCLLEVVNRAFYAQQNARIPLIGTILNLIIYIILGRILYRPLNAPGISLTDSISFSLQALFLLLILRMEPTKRNNRFYGKKGKQIMEDVPQMNAVPQLWGSMIRSLIGAGIAGVITYEAMHFDPVFPDNLVKSIIGMGAASLVYLIFILPEIKALRHF